MRISAKADYAVRAAVELATGEESQPMKGERVAEAQSIPLKSHLAAPEVSGLRGFSPSKRVGKVLNLSCPAGKAAGASARL